MTENYIHFTVRLLVCGYILYRCWIIVFNERLFGIWDKIPVRLPRGTPEPIITIITEKEVSEVVGKTRFVYLEDPELAAKVPAQTEELEPSDFIGEDSDIRDDDVVSDLSASSVTQEELEEEQDRFEVMDDLAMGLDQDFSTGLTYEEMANAVGVLTVAIDNEKQIIEAATTIYRIKDTDLFEFFTNQVSNLDNVEKLLNDCLDEEGDPLPRRRSKRNLEEFDMNRFV